MAKKTAKKNEKTVKVTTLKKMSAKEVMQKALSVKMFPETENDDAHIDLFTIMGMVTGTKRKSTAYGESIGLKGVFKAVRTHDGAKFVSNMAWLPDIVTDALVPALIHADGNPLEFAYTIGLQEDHSVARQYYYTAAAIIEQSQDPLAALEERIDQLLLDAPDGSAKE